MNFGQLGHEAQFKRQVDLVKPLLTIVLVQGQRVHLADLFLAMPHPATHTVHKPITNLAQNPAS